MTRSGQYRMEQQPPAGAALSDLPADTDFGEISRSGKVGWRCRYCGKGRIFHGTVREEAAEARAHEAQCGQGKSVVLPTDVVRRLFAYVQDADHAGLLEKCEDHLLADGGCEVCMDLETVQDALMRGGSPA